jgi:hypothetical protein
LNSIDPTSGPYNGGNWISFNGANFTTTCEVVWFNIPLADAKYRYCSSNTMICEAPGCVGQRHVPVQIQNAQKQISQICMYKYNKEKQEDKQGVATTQSTENYDISDFSVMSSLFHGENLLTFTISQPHIEENLSSDEIDEVNKLFLGTTLCYLTNIIRKRYVIGRWYI